MAKHDPIRRRIEKSVSERDLDVQIFIARLEKVLSREVSRLEARLLEGEIAAEQANFLIQDLFNKLRNGPIANEIRRIENLFAKELIRANELLEAGGISAREINFSKADLDLVESLIFSAEQEATIRLERYVNTIRTEVMRKILTGEKPNIENLRDELEPKQFSQLETEINTQAAATQRAAVMAKADRFGIDSFLYRGPDDKRTRPFCRHVLSKKPAIYTRAEIEELNSLPEASGMDVFTFCGGYNCRHYWSPVSDQRARELNEQQD